MVKRGRFGAQFENMQLLGVIEGSPADKYVDGSGSGSVSGASLSLSLTKKLLWRRFCFEGLLLCQAVLGQCQNKLNPLFQNNFCFGICFVSGMCCQVLAKLGRHLAETW